jgi:hypothetical protein
MAHDTLQDKVMKTTLPKAKVLATFAIFLGALLILTMPAAVVRAGNFAYTNNGETAFVSATNNDVHSMFNITAMQSTRLLCGDFNNPVGSCPLATVTTFNILGGHWVFNPTNSSLSTAYPTMYGAKYGAQTDVTGYHLNVLTQMHSSYALVGTGDFDVFGLKGGITDDTFSVTAPGHNDTVDIYPGTGTVGGWTTYNINIGPLGAVLINNGAPAASYSAGSTTSVYNIIF